MSIFDKDCPLCGSELPVSADGCECGFSFEPDSIVETAQDLEIAVQDEQLYANYLSARVTQTQEAIDSAKIILERDTKNTAFQNGVTSAEAEYKTACIENNAQIKKLATAGKAADVAKEAALKAQTEIKQQKAEAQAKTEAAAEQESEEARLRAVARAQTAREEDAREAARTKQVAEKQARTIKKQAQEILQRNEEEASKQARLAARAAHERQVAMAMALVSRADDDIKQAKIYGSANAVTDRSDDKVEIEAKQATVSKKKSPPAVVVSSATNKKHKNPDQQLDKIQHQLVQEKINRAPIISKKPDLVFKARQAIKAAAALMKKSESTGEKAPATQNIEVQANVNITPITEKLTRLATPEFKSQQRRNTDRLQALPKLVHNAAPICPHCTAEINVSSNKCKCGFVLEPTDTDDIGLVLSSADKDAMDAFSSISITQIS